MGGGVLFLGEEGPEARRDLADALWSLADTADALRRLAQVLETPSKIEFEST